MSILYFKYLPHCIVFLRHPPPPISGVCVTRSLVLYVCFVDRCLSFCTFSFGHCVVCSSIYGFWLPLWYLQTRLMNPSQCKLSLKQLINDLSCNYVPSTPYQLIFCEFNRYLKIQNKTMCVFFLIDVANYLLKVKVT